MNGKIFVPQYRSLADAQALLAYEQAMPGYEVIGFYSKKNLGGQKMRFIVIGMVCEKSYETVCVCVCGGREGEEGEIIYISMLLLNSD